MKYLVTYTTIDSKYGNPFWHSFMLLSKVEEGKKIKVIDNWGFYGVPTTTQSFYSRKLKVKLGLDIDLNGNHGLLKHEELRFLDLGESLHGVTFEVTEEQFTQLQDLCNKMNKDQYDAISEVVDSQGLQGKPAKEAKMYPHEEFSRIIFDLEKIKARQANRESRLKPFELNLNMTFWGPGFQQSHTCKSQIVNILASILTPEQIARITENGNHPTVPKYSGEMEEIFLHSSGPFKEHKKKSGEIVYYRDLADKGVELHWTFPPQIVESLDDSTDKLLTINEDLAGQAKKVVHQLQRLEWLIINTQVDDEYKEYQQHLISLLREHYEAFSVITEPKAKNTVTGWLGYGLSLLSMPRNEDERILLDKINNAKGLINSLYMALVDGMKIDNSILPEWQVEVKAEEDDDKEIIYNPIEALVSYLPEKDKITLCKIIGRTYLEPEEDEDVNDAEVNFAPHVPAKEEGRENSMRTM